MRDSPRRQPVADEFAVLEQMINPIPMQRRLSIKLSYAWLTWPTALVVAFAAICLTWIPPEHSMTAIYALANVTIVAIVCRRFLAVNPVTGLLPTVFLVPIAIEASVSTLYFCIMNPGAYVWVAGGVVQYLDNNAHFQLVTMACIWSSALPWLLFQRRGQGTLQYYDFLSKCRSFALPCFTVFFALVIGLLALRLLNISFKTPVGYVVYGFFRYSHSLPMIAGAAWSEMPRRHKWFVLGVLVTNALVNTLTNSRFYAFMPVVFFSFGLLFLGRAPSSRKALGMALTVAAFIVILVAGNTGRRIGLSLWYGGTEDLQRRYEVLTQKSQMFWHEKWMDEVFGRLFFTGGHQITTMLPGTYPYKVPAWPYYLAEVTTQGLLPRSLANLMVPPYHEEKTSLLLIGHKLTEKHGVERSFIGAAWELGGYPPVIVISMLASFFLLFLIWLIDKIYPQSPYWMLVTFTILCDSVLWSINEGLPSMAHEYIYCFIVGYPIYYAAWFLGTTFLRPNPTRLIAATWPSMPHGANAPS
jgi:hypothetical protein